MEERSGCSVLDWARSGAMFLTGPADGPPTWPSGDVIGQLGTVARLYERSALTLGVDLRVDVGALLTARAAARRLSRQGRTSAGGWCRLFRAADGWIAVNLARPGDRELLPAWSDGRLATAASWAEIEQVVSRGRAAELVDRAQLLGIPVSRLGRAPASGGLWSIERLGKPAATPATRPLVVDFSAMWAGPLCAHLWDRCGARVVKVEDPGRPDAAREGDPWLFDELHRDHELISFDFGDPADRQSLMELVEEADVLIEASRPRALAALGLAPERFLSARPGRVWVSISGYGRRGSRANWVAFGDDAAVAGGMVGMAADEPVFCGDAMADPVTGLCAAAAAVTSWSEGGGCLVDCSMAGASAAVNFGVGCDGSHHIERQGTGWVAVHEDGHGRTASARVEGPVRRDHLAGIGPVTGTR